MGLDRKYLLFALAYAIFGMCVGLYMAASHNHGELVAHAHILLVGFVVSFIYSIIHKLWLPRPGRIVARVQFWLHHVASISLFAGLLLLYGHVVPDEKIGPLLGMASVGVLVGVLMMGYMVLKARPEAT